MVIYKGTAGNDGMWRAVVILVLCGNKNCWIGSISSCVLCKGTSSNCGRSVGQYNAGEAVSFCIAAFKAAAVNVEGASRLAFYCIDTTSVGATLEGHGSPVVSHGGAGIACGGSHIGKLNGTGGIGFSAALDVIVACAAHNGTVLYGNHGVVANEQGRLAAAGVGQGLAAQIQSQLFAGDRDILGGIGHQRYGIVILSGCDSLCQGGVLVFTNGCHGILHGYGVKTIFTGNRLIIF